MAFAHISVEKAFFQEFIYLFISNKNDKTNKKKTTGGNKMPNNNLLLIVHARKFAVKTTHSIGKKWTDTANGPVNKTQRLNSLKQTGCHLSLYMFCLLMKGFTSFVNT